MSHVIMKKNLAKALMDAGMEHFDFGGMLTGGLLSSGQNGVSSNYKPPPINTQNFMPQIQNLQGEQQNTYNQQQSLANTLLNQSNGMGPNPAQAALNQNTGTNVANQASLMASQRGAAANPGQIARMAAQQGAATQQGAVGQAATLEAQQRLAEQQAAQNSYNQMAGQALQGENIQQTGNAAQNTAINNGGIATNQLNAGIQESNAAAANSLMGSLGNAAGAVGNYFKPLVSNLGSAGSDIFAGVGDAASNASAVVAGGGDAIAGGAANIMPVVGEAAPLAVSAHGGKVPFSRALLKSGGTVPGKATVQGDSEENDTQPTLLSPKEVVLPRTVTMADDAPARAAEFVRQLQGQHKATTNGYGKVLEAKKSLKERVEHLEKLACGGYAMRGA